MAGFSDTIEIHGHFQIPRGLPLETHIFYLYCIDSVMLCISPCGWRRPTRYTINTITEVRCIYSTPILAENDWCPFFIFSTQKSKILLLVLLYLTKKRTVLLQSPASSANIIVMYASYLEYNRPILIGYDR